MSYGILNLLFTDYNLLFKKTIVWRARLFLPSYLMVLSMYFLLSSMQKVKDQQLQQSQMQAMIKEAEFNALKAQINPHFLFNSLNAATSLTLSDPQKARDMIINIADFFRFSLLSEKKPFWTLSDELEHALLYLEIERGRFADKLIVVSDLPIEMKDLMLPTLLLQPLVENAVKHGVYESSKPIHIHFTFENRIDYYSISIGNEINNQAGTPKKGTQTGLQNVASRLEIAYGSKQLISSQKTENQFIVKVSIPKKLSHATTESRNH
jgi:LytS/YehU family sensor histidine kinase